MLLRIISDIHMESHPNYSIDEMPGEAEQTLILAGDITPYHQIDKRHEFFSDISKRFKNIVYVPGNHEYYHGDINEGDDILRDYFSNFSNFYFINKEVLYLDDKKIVGCTLWTEIDPVSEVNYGRFLSDYICIKSGDNTLTPSRTIFMHRDHNKFIRENVDNETIVITHHCPSFRSIHEKFRNSDLNPFFYNDMDNLIYELQPKLWIHGHTHCSMDYKIDNTHVICNPKGYFNPYEYGSPENIEYDEFMLYPV